MKTINVNINVVDFEVQDLFFDITTQKENVQLKKELRMIMKGLNARIFDDGQVRLIEKKIKQFIKCFPQFVKRKNTLSISHRLVILMDPLSKKTLISISIQTIPIEITLSKEQVESWNHRFTNRNVVDKMFNSLQN